VEPAGAPFALYHNMDMSALDVEIVDAYDRLTAFVKEKGLDTEEYCYE
jgi:hypothetical protein